MWLVMYVTNRLHSTQLHPLSIMIHFYWQHLKYSVYLCQYAKFNFWLFNFSGA